MIIVLTSEQELENEAGKINQLFDHGLEILHLRKPSFDIDGYRRLIEQVEAKYHNRIMLHQFHELCEEFNLRGIHIQEQSRFDLGNNLNTYVHEFEEKGFKVTSSFHDKETIVACPVKFDYVLLSPVFGSISKAGYEGKGFDVNDLDEFVIGMGGINEKTLKKTFELGFKGVGVLGGIWNSANFLDSYMAMQDKLNEVV
ncbi:thiamine phosphate synthase [Flavobacteriaceae bacterium R38]|nr:thiamine phosphate synthase [Flavobacteriaceae bacterium R38]